MWAVPTGKLHALARAMLWIAGATAVFSTNTIRLARRAGASSRPRAVLGRDHLGLLVAHRDRLAGITSQCDPELSITSTIQMLPSGWITRWRRSPGNPGV